MNQNYYQTYTSPQDERLLGGPVLPFIAGVALSPLFGPRPYPNPYPYPYPYPYQPRPYPYTPYPYPYPPKHHHHPHPPFPPYKKW